MKKPSEIEKPKEKYSDDEVHRKIMSEAIQHPTTLVPLAAAILSGLYLGLVSFNETAFAVAAGSAVVTLLSWAYHFFFRGDKVAEEYIMGLKEQRADYKVRQSEDIIEKCSEVGFYLGKNSAKELKEAYLRLDEFLEEKAGQGKSGASRFKVLAEDCYEQGVSFLNKALSMYNVSRKIDPDKLKRELNAWNRDIIKLEKRRAKEGDYIETSILALQKRVDSHMRRIERYDKNMETIKQLLAQCEILEATMDSAYLEFADTMETDFKVQQDNVASNLERAVETARRVEDKLRGNKKDEYDDSIYLQQNE